MFPLAEKKEFSVKSDVWSFGVTMWEVLSYGDRPWPGLKKDQVKERLRSSQHMEAPPNYLRQVTDNRFYITTQPAHTFLTG